MEGAEVERRAPESIESGSSVPSDARWKLAFQQLRFIDTLNDDLEELSKKDIKHYQEDISAVSLLCSVPFFYFLSPEEITELGQSCSEQTISKGKSISSSLSNGSLEEFCIVSKGKLIVKNKQQKHLDDTISIQQTELGIGSYYLMQESVEIPSATEDTTCLMISMQTIERINFESAVAIRASACSSDGYLQEMENLRHWTKQYGSTEDEAVNEEHTSDESEGFANCSMTTFTKDHLSHICPENELDHTLDYVKTALISVFNASRMHIYVVDTEQQQLFIKFADEYVANPCIEMDEGIGKWMMEKKSPMFIDNTTDRLNEDLYRFDECSLSTPFMEYTSNGPRTDKVVGILELVLDKRVKSVNEPSTAAEAQPTLTASKNDFKILKAMTEALNRYLHFHCEGFFSLDEMNVVSQDDGEKMDPTVRKSVRTSFTEILPAPNTPVAPATTHLVAKVTGLSLTLPDVICKARVSIRLGEEAIAVVTSAVHAAKEKTSGSGQSRVWTVESKDVASMPLADVPHGSHILIEFLKNSGVCAAWSGIHLFDFGHNMRLGKWALNVQKSTSPLSALSIENCARKSIQGKMCYAGNVQLTLESHGARVQSFSYSSVEEKEEKEKKVSFRASIFRSSIDTPISPVISIDTSLDMLSNEEQELLQRIRHDPIVDLTADQRRFLWDSRETLAQDAALLPAFLSSVNWSHREYVLEAYRMMHCWCQPTYLQALQLLSPHYADPKVRAYAVRCMDGLSDHRLRLLLLQLVQALKHERYHDSALARFLLRRGLRNSPEIGYLLFWYLKAEMHLDETAERFKFLADQYLELCGSHRLEIRQSDYIMTQLVRVAMQVKKQTSDADRIQTLHSQLNRLVLPAAFQLPLHPRVFCSSIQVEKCRVMDSSKRPLMLQFVNTKPQHGDPFMIFKCGDDLRQDQLVLQLLRIIEDLWLESDIDLRLLPYACVATGDGIGMIEVVPESDTLAGIIYKRHKGAWTRAGRNVSSAKDALSTNKVLSEWLFKTSLKETAKVGSMDNAGMPPPPTCFSPLFSSRKSKYVLDRDEDVVDNFMRSCAGYCVATFVLGIGDRHNDNLMLQRSGKLFHIDFGHFLGHIKYWAGIKRERAPFVLTPAMAHVLGGEHSDRFQEFKSLAIQAFLVLRKHSNLLITLLELALSCGVPELATEKDIHWMHNTLMLKLTEDEASKRFEKLIIASLHTRATQVNDAVHLLVH